MKKLITILSCAVLLTAVFAGCTGETGTPTTAPAPTQESTEVKTTAPATVITTQAEPTTVTESTEISSETEKPAPKNTYIYKGAWYIFNEENRTAYAFRFNGEKVKIAFFDSDNTDGMDAKYFTANEKYTDSGDIITFDDPMNASQPFELKVKDNKLYYNGKALSHEKETSLEIAFDHFNS